MCLLKSISEYSTALQMAERCGKDPKTEREPLYPWERGWGEGRNAASRALPFPDGHSWQATWGHSRMLRAMWLSLLPWGFVLLGLLPLWLFPRQESIYPGLVFLLAALILAAAASLYARVPLGPQVRLFWVLGLGLMSSVLAVAASRDLAQVPEDVAATAAVASLMGGVMFLLGLFFLLRREVPGLPSPMQMGFRHDGGVLPYSALQVLAPSLETLSAVRPVTLLLLHTRSEQPGTELLQFLRQPDMVFELKPGQFLIVLQGSNLEGAQAVFRRIRQNLVIRAYGVLPLQGRSLQQALVQLEGELAHYYLTQH